ncbi:MAG: S8 family serine peptidase [Endomicrobia bacterium]|nr:S8 family serine peptidase [Endomicrobiia bacterium]MCL2507287.1 S8 family serine peptidase [Endomicrobiia bacterium]
MKNKILKTFKAILVLLLLVSISAPVYAAVRSKISGRLLHEASQQPSFSPAAFGKSSTEEKDYINVLFYPVNKDSKNIDLSFFKSRNIEYFKSRSFVRAKVPKTMIKDLENVSGAQFIDISYKARALEIYSEGRNSINASTFYFNNVNGDGVKIAIMDIEFQGYAALQSRGELPSNLITKDFTGGYYTTPSDAPPIDPTIRDGIHGAACAEIVYDIAPGAQMYLLKIDYETSMENALDYCVSEGIHIVSASIGWSIGDSFMDGTGPIAQLAEAAVSSGTLCVFAAGNEATYSWFGMFSDGGNSDGYMRFPSGADNFYLYVPFENEVVFTWDDYDGSTIEYIMEVYDQNNNYILSTEPMWASGSVPCVAFNNFYTSSTNFRFKIKKKNPTDPNLHFRLYYQNCRFLGNPLDNINPQSSLSSPADARSVLTVGAISIQNWTSGPIEYFSSRGPSRANANYPYALNPAIKPEICGPDGVTTISYGQRNFYGTSAATPHVAGAAALLLSLSSFTLNVADLKAEVIKYAKPVGTSPDSNYGYGKLVLDTSIIPWAADAGNIVCYPNPVSISKKGYIKITNLPYNTSFIEINVFTVTGEFVKTFGPSDAVPDANGRKTITWNLRNQHGNSIAPGVYFVVVNTPINQKVVKKIAIQK